MELPWSIGNVIFYAFHPTILMIYIILHQNIIKNIQYI